jgi:hypothetical protein
MDVLISLSIVLFIVLVIVTVLGHAIWLLCEAVVRRLTSSTPATTNSSILSWRCETCNAEVRMSWSFCGGCGSAKPSHNRIPGLKNLFVTERELGRLFGEGKLDPGTFEIVSGVLRAERPPFIPTERSPKAAEKQRVEESDVTADAPRFEAPVLIIKGPEVVSHALNLVSNSAKDIVETPLPPPTPRPPRRSLSEVLNSFMEESNIRWGEIIGGLLIIGCSTALVVSLWSQISEIPVLKFLIFTTVTAVSFGIGMYTEHRWKLPTTSRGILTIATLLVPLNFLAIAAVSSSETSGPLVLASELLAPAIFLCLVYFGGRIITPGCAHLLAAGVLGSSVGQLLVRHFASVDASPLMLIFLGGFPVAFYLTTLVFALRRVLADAKNDESEITTVFTVLGTMSFAALLPFGLLLYKSGPLWLSMMYLAPLVTLLGVPMLATGTVLWRRIQDQSLAASRTTGTALGILGLMVALAGMALAWPNPASIVSAALLNVAILTTLALVLEVPVAHTLAAGCFALGYLVFFHVAAGNVEWQNLRVTSLVGSCLQMSSGQVLIGAFAIFLIAHEWLKQIGRRRESQCYLVSSCLIGLTSLLAVTAFGPLGGNDLQIVWVVYAIYSFGAFWIAKRQELTGFIWVGSALVLFALASQFAWSTELSFPWQTAFLVHATITTVAAILSSRRTDLKRMSGCLNYAALTSLMLAVISFFQANPWQVTWMQAGRVFWIAGILLASLWLNRRQLLFIALQIALTAGIILSVKATLQEYEWYTYLPHAFLHPAALLIQGTMLALLSLVFIAARVILKKVAADDSHALAGIWKLLDTKQSVDRIIPWFLLACFLLLSVYSAASGLMQELLGAKTPAWNIAGFAHQEAYGAGSWIILGLLTVIMLANAWERRQRIYALGALVTVSAVIPLLSGRFESELATATAWRFLAAIFLLVGSLLLWARERLGLLIRSFGWPEFIESGEDFSEAARVLLFVLTVAPLLVLTFCAALLVPVAPVQGVFSILNNELSYALPLIIVAAVCSGYAIRERSPWFNFYSCLLINAAVTVTHLFSVDAAAPLDSIFWVRTIQLNAITLAVHALVWHSLCSQWLRALEHRAVAVDSVLTLEIGLAAALNIGLLAPLAGLLVLENQPGIATLSAGSYLGWFAFAVTCFALVVLKRTRGQTISAEIFASILLGIACLTSFGFASSDNSLALCTLTAGVTVAAWLIFFGAWLPRLDNSVGVCSVVLGLATILGLRLLPVIGPERAWWSILPLLALSALAASLQVRTLNRSYLYAAGILFNIALSVWWLSFPSHFAPGISFLEVNIIGASLTAVLWLFLELRSRKLQVGKVGRVALSYHNVVALCSVILLIVATAVRFESSVVSGRQFIELLWLAFAATTLLMAATLWDATAKYATAGLYTLGLVSAAIVLLQLNLPYNDQVWSVMMFLAVYGLIAALLWHKRATILALIERVGITPRIPPETTHVTWLSVVTVLEVIAVASIAFWANLTFMNPVLRVSAALAVIAQSVTLGFFSEGSRSARWCRASIALFVLGTVLLGWAWLTPGVDATWFNRSVILMVEAFSLTVLFSVFSKSVRKTPWASSSRDCLPALLSAVVIALVFCLGNEISFQLSFGAVRIHPVSLVAIGLTLLAGAIVPVLFAVLPVHDPLSLQESGRMKYVYAAETMLALLILHVRLTMPWLFTGFFEDYWPFVVMVISYLGVISSESLRRRKLFVLAQPVERTGVFLPLLPVIGFWVATSQVDYSSLLFVVGGLYGLLSTLRKSFIFGAMAAVAGNAGFWYVLQRTDNYQFFQHPQLWLIPVALSVLVGAYLNEDRLQEDQLAAVRYLSLVTIYASSTADMFINGVSNSPWLPLILGAFSLAGVFSGIMFRIRGLLLLGSVFLLLSIVTMIWYASVNLGWTWLWYVAGIATGATIIFMFAVFEKKRSEVLRVVEGLKDWDV